jgi:hypothetical protein
VTVIALNSWSESDQKAIREQLDRILKRAARSINRAADSGFSNTLSMKHWLGVVSG